MKKARLIATLPPNPKYVQVRVLSVSTDMSEGWFEAYADVEEYEPYSPPPLGLMDSGFWEPGMDGPFFGRKGTVRLSTAGALDLMNNPNYLIRVEEAHVNWK